MSAPDGGSAFPEAGMAGLPNGEVVWGQPGMTLRDYFAAQAMIGLFGFWVAVNAKTNINDPDPDIVSEMAYEYADAMLEARSAQ